MKKFFYPLALLVYFQPLPGVADQTITVKPGIRLQQATTVLKKSTTTPKTFNLVVRDLSVDTACHLVVTIANAGPGVPFNDEWTAPLQKRLLVKIDNGAPHEVLLSQFDPHRQLQPVGSTLVYTTPITITGSQTIAAVITDGTGDTKLSSNTPVTTTLTCNENNTAEQKQTIAPATTEQAAIAPPPVASTTGTGALSQTALPPPPADLPPPVHKQDKTIEPGELLVISADITQAQYLAQIAQQAGLSVKRRTYLSGLGFVVTVLRVPKDVAVADALTKLRQALPNTWMDANHRYTLFGDDSVRYGQKLIGSAPVSPNCGQGMRIGLVDTAIDHTHPTFSQRAITGQDFLPVGIKPAKANHGTAIGALLVGQTLPSGFSGMLPAATLYSASVFRDTGDGVDTTAEWIVRALDWLVQQHVQLINLSLGGPRNLLLEAAITRLLALHIMVVAAAGNGGPDAAPAYPAAQAGVIAVTAVDANKHLWAKANQGNYISYAAPGVDVWSAQPGNDGAYLSGTSYAVPFVVAALVSVYQATPQRSWEAIQQTLQAQALDLGAHGKDPVYGWGLVQMKSCVSPTKKRSRHHPGKQKAKS